MKNLVTAFFLFSAFTGSAQTLFYYGNDSVSVKDFLQAYHKNNAVPGGKKALSNYLDLYIDSRLKIKEAEARGYDTLPQLTADLANLRQQILPSYLNDKESLDKLIDEAILRSQKDIHLAQLFISFTQNGVYDTVAAHNKLNEVLNALKSGRSFSETARKYSDDPSAKQNGGDLGYITVFTLPYELENLAYATQPGKVSAVYRSNAGYHIVKNLGERKALGRIKAAQLLLAFPPGADDHYKEKIREKADSLYERLKKGDDFARLAAQYSNDVASASANGVMPVFGVGEYDPVFEHTVFALSEDGAISKPFLTAYGYHIVKRISRIPAGISKKDTKAIDALRERIEQSDRINSTRNALAEKILKKAGFTKASFTDAELWAYSDSILNYKKPSIPVQLTGQSVLFMLGKKPITTSDWISYAETYRYKPDGSGLKPYPLLWNEFVHATALNYYQANLEQFNEEFRHQLNEFKEGNLFFEIMQRQIWGPAQTDSVALFNYYQKNKQHYKWEQSADAIVFYVNEHTALPSFTEQLKKDPANWHALVAQYSDKLAADSARFEFSQLPNGARQVLKAGTITAPVTNKTDNTASFAYILNTYPAGEQRSFADAKGLVINDYQNELEKNWLQELKKKYPVRINEKALQTLEKEMNSK